MHSAIPVKLIKKKIYIFYILYILLDSRKNILCKSILSLSQSLSLSLSLSHCFIIIDFSFIFPLYLHIESVCLCVPLSPTFSLSQCLCAFIVCCLLFYYILCCFYYFLLLQGGFCVQEKKNLSRSLSLADIHTHAYIYKHIYTHV